MPDVTVLMPVYNAEAFLPECIDSILHQTFSDFQLIICNDASTDGSLAILERYATQDQRIRLLENKQNAGIAKTRNTLLHALSTDTRFVAIMDSDDICLPDRLRLQVDFLERHPDIAGVGGSLEIIDQQGKTVGFRSYPTEPTCLKKTILKYNPFAQSTMMLRHELIDSCGDYRTDLPVCEDYDYWFRALELADFANLSCPLIRYRINPAQSKQSKLKQTLGLTLKIQRSYLRHPSFRSIGGSIHHLALYPLLLLPNSLIMTLFKWITYKK